MQNNTNNLKIQQPIAIKPLPPSAMYNIGFMKLAAMTHMVAN